TTWARMSPRRRNDASGGLSTLSRWAPISIRDPHPLAPPPLCGGGGMFGLGDTPSAPGRGAGPCCPARGGAAGPPRGLRPAPVGGFAPGLHASPRRPLRSPARAPHGRGGAEAELLQLREELAPGGLGQGAVVGRAATGRGEPGDHVHRLVEAGVGER